MRYREIVAEVVGRNHEVQTRIEELDAEFEDRGLLLQVMYSHGALDWEVEAEELEAARLDNERARLDVERMRLELETQIADESDVLDDALTRAKIAKTKAEAAAKLVEL